MLNKELLLMGSPKKEPTLTVRCMYDRSVAWLYNKNLEPEMLRGKNVWVFPNKDVEYIETSYAVETVNLVPYGGRNAYKIGDVTQDALLVVGYTGGSN